MALSVDDECPSPAVQDLSSYEVRRIGVAQLNPPTMVLRVHYVIPIDWRITGKHAQALTGRQGSVHAANGLDQLARMLPQAIRNGVIFPCASNHRVRHGLPSHVAVQHV